MPRTIIEIDEALCDGCGQCVSGCAEGALAVIDGKARLVSETYCDGLGACLGHCPQGAIRTVEREAAEFDPAAVEEHLKRPGGSSPSSTKVPTPGGASPSSTGPHHGCPGSMARSLGGSSPCSTEPHHAGPSRLGSWPVQLALVSPGAPYLQGADLLLCADCVPCAVPDFHARYLAGKIPLLACPKLDDIRAHTRKLIEIIGAAKPRSITVLRMEVPCCGGLAQAATVARDLTDPDLPVHVVVIGIDGPARAA